MPRAYSKNLSKFLGSNLLLALPNLSPPSQASLLLEVPSPNQKANNSNNKSNLATSKRSWRLYSSRKSSKTYKHKKNHKEINKKKLEKVL